MRDIKMLIGRFGAVMNRMAELVDPEAVAEMRAADLKGKIERSELFVRVIRDQWDPPKRVKNAADATLGWLGNFGRSVRAKETGFNTPDDVADDVLALVEWLEGEFRDLDGKIRGSIQRN